MPLLFAAYAAFAQESQIEGLVSFSTEPGGTPKTQFNSSDFIYGSITFNASVEEYLNDAFWISPAYDETWILFGYQLEVLKDGKLVAHSEPGYFRYADFKTKSLTFDVLPDPLLAKTCLSADTKFEMSRRPAPLGALIGNGSLLEDGTYQVRIRISAAKDSRYTVNEWPAMVTEFQFNYKTADKIKCSQNYESALDKLAPGRFYFSNQPFSDHHEGAKTHFKSSEFIYGRLELPVTLEEFFKIPQTTKALPASSLIHKITIYQKGERVQWGTSVYIRVGNLDRKATYFNFDILPEPAKATTIIASGPELVQGARSVVLPAMLTDRSQFPEEGSYTVSLKLSAKTYDPYDPTSPNPEEKWINCVGDFDIEFSVNDVPALLQQQKDANALVQENAKVKTIEDRGLPAEWNMASGTIVCGYSQSQIEAMFLAGQESGYKIIKTVIQPTSDVNWHIEKNELDIPVMKYHNQPLGFFVSFGGSYFYFEGYLAQTYEGGGNYGKVYYEWYRKDEVGAKFIQAALSK